MSRCCVPRRMIGAIACFGLIAAHLCGTADLQAAIMTSGNVLPAVPPDGALGATPLVVGDTTLAALTVSAGSDLVSGQTTIAQAPSSIAAVLVTGEDSTWRIGSYLYVGESGAAALSIENGGSIQAQSALVGVNSSSTSQLNIHGAGSQFSTTLELTYPTLWVNNGTFNITDGGTASTGLAWLRNHVVGQGAALVDGAGSRWEAGAILIADRGSLRVRNGAVVDANSIASGIDDGFTADTNFDANTLIEVDGPGSRLSGNVTVANYSSWSRPATSRSELIVRNGATFDGSLAAGFDEDVAAHITIENPGTTWNYGTATIGDRGPTRFTLRDGAKASGGWVAIATGTGGPLSAQAVVEGPGTEWRIGTAPGGTQGLLLGAYTASGSFDIRSGALVTAGRTEIGYVGNGVNRVTAAGQGTKFEHGNTDIGTYGRGLLEVRAGATAAGKSVRLGVEHLARGEVLVDGPGSTWTVDDLQLSYGSENFATVRVRSGGKLIVENVWLSGRQSTNLIDVDGPNATLEITGELRHGDSASGESSIQLRRGAQGKIHTAYIGQAGGESNLVELRDTGTLLHVEDKLVLGREYVDSFTPIDILSAFAGSTVHIGKVLELGANGRFQLFRGKAVVGELIEPPNENVLTNSIGGLVTGVGLIDAHLSNGGTLAPGLSAGKLEIAGNFFQVGQGTLEIEIGGTAPDLYDRLQIGGATQIRGTLQVALLDGFVPEIGAHFTILDSFRPIAGDFQNFILPQLPPDRLWDTRLDGGAYKLSVVPVPEPSALALAVGLLAVLARRPGSTRRPRRKPR